MLTGGRRGEDGVVIRHHAVSRNVLLLFGRITRAVLDRRPMLFRNPYPAIQLGPDRHAANLAGVIGPLGSILVSSKNCLHFIAEASLARLCGYRHDSP